MCFISRVIPLRALLVLFSFLLNITNAQIPTIEWQNTIGGNYLDYLTSVQQTNDNGYILGGHSYSGKWGDKTEAGQGEWDYWIVKLDESGEIIWQNTIRSSMDDYLSSIQQTTDGGYILGGYSDSDISGDKTEASQGEYDYWVLKLDGSGNIVWQSTIGGNDEDKLLSVQQTRYSGYILGGQSSSGISGDKTEASQGGYDYWIVKLDSNGNIIWQNTIGGSSEDLLCNVQQTSDDGYILGGRSESDMSGDKNENNTGESDYWVVKLSPDPVISVEDQSIVTIPDQLTVFLSYPNPFNSSTTIHYNLPEDG
jgi:hypothetical protein